MEFNFPFPLRDQIGIPFFDHFSFLKLHLITDRVAYVLFDMQIVALQYGGKCSNLDAFFCFVYVLPVIVMVVCIYREVILWLTRADEGIFCDYSFCFSFIDLLFGYKLWKEAFLFSL